MGEFIHFSGEKFGVIKVAKNVRKCEDKAELHYCDALPFKMDFIKLMQQI